MTRKEYQPYESTDPVPELEAPVVVTAPAPDTDAGKGGSYMRDPSTGERVLIARTTGCCGE